MSAPNKNPAILDKLGLSGGPAGLMTQARSDISAEHYLRLASLVDRDPYCLAAALGITEARIQQWIAGGEVDIEEIDGVYRLILVVDATLQLFEADVAAAQIWLKGPCRGLGGKAPFEMLTTHTEMQAVLDLIGRLEHGVAI